MTDAEAAEEEFSPLAGLGTADILHRMYVVALGQRMVNAISDDNMEQLSEFLLNGYNGFAATALDFELAFNMAAGELGNLEACQMIWETASTRSDADYLITCCLHPLHKAAEFGRVEIVHYLLPLLFSHVNKMDEDDDGHTPLYLAIKPACQFYVETGRATNDNIVEITRLLLENGNANPNRGRSSQHYKGKDIPLYIAVRTGNTDVVRLLYKHGADGRKRSNQEEYKCCVIIAIERGYAEILDMLFQHGAITDISTLFTTHSFPSSYSKTLLNVLLCDEDKSRETKLAICRILVQHRATAAMMDHSDATTMLLETSLKHAIHEAQNEACEIFLEAGCIVADPGSGGRAATLMLYTAIQAENEAAARLLIHYGADPFSLEQAEDNDGNNRVSSSSPFQAAARQQKEDGVGILRLFLQHWNERFSSNGGGKNDNGDSALHVLCRDPRGLSIQAIKLLVEEFKANVSEAAAAPGGHVGDIIGGRLPFHLAVNMLPDDTVSLDIVFFLLRQYPDVLTKRNY